MPIIAYYLIAILGTAIYSWLVSRCTLKAAHMLDMITKIYAHILDEDRKVNTQKFETAFYTKRNPDLRATPQKERLTALRDASLPIFRHISKKAS